MADIIEKIGKYFADQEAQLRHKYAQEAAASAAPAIGASNVVPPAARRAELAEKPSVEDKPPSLVRRRLSLTREVGESTRGNQIKSDREEKASERPAIVSSDSVSRSTRSESGGADDSASSSTLSVRSTRSAKVKKKKRKKKKAVAIPSKEDEEKAKLQRAAEGFARAQERARQLQVEKTMRERQKQSERAANAARLQEEMSKIEEIRRRGKTFAMRLRPQSAPTTPPPQEAPSSQPWTKEDEAPKPEERMETKPPTGFLAEIERQMETQMLAEMHENERLFRVHAQEEEERARLEAQIRKTNDHNAIKQERIDSLMRANEAMAKEIRENQALALEIKQQRLQLEEKNRRERQLKQREAEREIQARLLREESQRLVDEERKRSGVAAEARAKAKQRVQSRAALLKRVLHGCDIRSDTKASRNQEEDVDASQTEPNKSPLIAEATPELAEFEEDGLAGDHGPPRSPRRLNLPLLFQTVSKGTSSFQWRVPVLSYSQIHLILQEELINLSDDD